MRGGCQPAIGRRGGALGDGRRLVSESSKKANCKITAEIFSSFKQQHTCEAEVHGRSGERVNECIAAEFEGLPFPTLVHPSSHRYASSDVQSVTHSSTMAQYAPLASHSTAQLPLYSPESPSRTPGSSVRTSPTRSAADEKALLATTNDTTDEEEELEREIKDYANPPPSSSPPSWTQRLPVSTMPCVLRVAACRPLDPRS